MIRFENIEYLYVLGLIPVFIILYVLMIYWRKNAISTFGDSRLMEKLIPLKSTGRPLIKFLLSMLAFSSLVIAIANPQVGSRLEKVKRKGVDLIIALDVSNSMLAQDIKPNRLAASKQAISNLIDKLEGDRLGIIVFAGNAYVQLPITTDYAATKLLLSRLFYKIVLST